MFLMIQKVKYFLPNAGCCCCYAHIGTPCQCPFSMALIRWGINEIPIQQHQQQQILDYLEQALTHTHTYILIHTLSQILSLTWASFSVEREREREREREKEPFRWTVEYFGRFVLWSLPIPTSLSHTLLHLLSLSLTHTSARLITSNRCQAGHIEPRFQFP